MMDSYTVGHSLVHKQDKITQTTFWNTEDKCTCKIHREQTLKCNTIKCNTLFGPRLEKTFLARFADNKGADQPAQIAV